MSEGVGTGATEPADVTVRIQRLPHLREIALPAFATPEAAGADIRAALEAPLTLAPGERALVPTGFALALPPGWEAQVRPRSGLALRHGLSVVNTPGTVDSDYRGEVKVLLVNHGAEAVTLGRGERIAQMVVARVPRVCFQEVDSLPESGRGAGGYGSTGTA